MDASDSSIDPVKNGADIKDGSNDTAIKATGFVATAPTLASAAVMTALTLAAAAPMISAAVGNNVMLYTRNVMSNDRLRGCQCLQ